MLALPGDSRYFLCHDYVPEDAREPQACFSHTEQLRNVHLAPEVDEAAFVSMRERRDAELNTPRLIIPSLQINIRAGSLPPAEDNGKRYVKLPLETSVLPPERPGRNPVHKT